MYGDGPLNQKFGSIGFESQIWIQNMSTNFIVLASYVSTIFITYLVTPVFRNVDNAKDGEDPKRFSGAWFKANIKNLNTTSKQYLIVSMMEMFIEVSVSTWVNIKSLLINY